MVPPGLSHYGLRHLSAWYVVAAVQLAVKHLIMFPGLLYGLKAQVELALERGNVFTFKKELDGISIQLFLLLTLIP